MRTLLKALNFRWNPKKGLWYGFVPEAELVKKLGGRKVPLDGKAQTPAKVPTPAKTAKTPAKAPAKKPAVNAKPKTTPDTDLFSTETPDTTIYYRALTSGDYELRSGILDGETATVIEKIDGVWTATDYATGYKVASASSKKALQEKLESDTLTDKLSALRVTEKYNRLKDSLESYLAEEVA